MKKKMYLEARTVEELCELMHLPKSLAPRVKMRVDLVSAIHRLIEKKGWTHEEAAKRANVGRTVITAIMNGNMDKLNTERLLGIAHDLGIKVDLKIAI